MIQDEKIRKVTEISKSSQRQSLEFKDSKQRNSIDEVYHKLEELFLADGILVHQSNINRNKN